VGSGAVLVRGVLEEGGFLDWRPADGATIHVGSDPQCQWRIAAPGVARFHLQLCWYAGRLWIAEIESRTTGGCRWLMAPLGVAIRVGRTSLTLETAASYAPAAPPPAAYATTGSAHATGSVHAAPRVNAHLTASSVPARADAASWTPGASFAPSGSSDPDATQLVDTNELRALPWFGPAATRAPDPAPAWTPPSGGPSLEEMFIVPAEQAAPPPRRPDRLARLVAAVPMRAVFALVAAGGMALVVFLPESLQASRNRPPPAALPVRRPPPPEAEIEVRAVKPLTLRAAAESAAAHDLATGRLQEALTGYRALEKELPDDPVFRDFADIIERRIKARCEQGGCPEEGAK
jgi:hypothetical protein